MSRFVRERKQSVETRLRRIVPHVDAWFFSGFKNTFGSEIFEEMFAEYVEMDPADAVTALTTRSVLEKHAMDASGGDSHKVQEAFKYMDELRALFTE